MNDKALIVGLGNPTKKYADTRHNLGFKVVERFALRHGCSFKSRRKMHGRVSVNELAGKRVVLLLPKTYMNRSGIAVRETMYYHRVPLSSLIIVTDDIALGFGVLRFRQKGSAGGHNGLKDVEAQLGTQDYRRLRIGIGEPSGECLEEFVLSPFTEEEQGRLAEVTEEGADFLDRWLMEGSV